jgi:hypothetical protein
MGEKYGEGQIFGEGNLGSVRCNDFGTSQLILLQWAWKSQKKHYYSTLPAEAANKAK